MAADQQPTPVAGLVLEGHRGERPVIRALARGAVTLVESIRRWLTSHALTLQTTEHAVVLGAPQLTACFTSALIRASTSAVISVRAKAAAHIVPSSSFA